jgi:hypothetical protein
MLNNHEITNFFVNPKKILDRLQKSGSEVRGLTGGWGTNCWIAIRIGAVLGRAGQLVFCTFDTLPI